LLGRWLPMLPASLEAVTPWVASAGAAQILICALSAFYLIRKVLPWRVSNAHLSVSVENVRRGHLHTMVTASLSPVGLVHWLHACLAILVCTAGLEGTVSRWQLVLLFLASGGASSVACILTQAMFGRRQQSRSSVCGAVMGLLLLRAAADPQEPLAIGHTSVRPVRAALMHLVLDVMSNSLPPPSPLGIEKLFALLGASIFVACIRPTLREAIAGVVRDGSSWNEVLSQLRAAL